MAFPGLVVRILLPLLQNDHFQYQTKPTNNWEKIKSIAILLQAIQHANRPVNWVICQKKSSHLRV